MGWAQPCWLRSCHLSCRGTVSPTGLGHGAHPGTGSGMSGPSAAFQTRIPTGHSHNCFAGRSSLRKHSGGLGLGGGHGVCAGARPEVTTTLGLPVQHYPCTRHLLIPKTTIMTLLELPLKPSNSSAASRWLCRVPSIPDREIPTPKAAALRLCGTALCCRWPWGHRPRPLLRVETPGFMPPEGFLKDLGATRLPQEDAASMVPRHDKQQSPGGASACLGFPFSLAGSRSGDYFWCCLTLERVTHGQGITPDPAPRCGQRK